MAAEQENSNLRAPKKVAAIRSYIVTQVLVFPQQRARFLAQYAHIDTATSGKRKEVEEQIEEIPHQFSKKKQQSTNKKPKRSVSPLPNHPIGMLYAGTIIQVKLLY